MEPRVAPAGASGLASSSVDGMNASTTSTSISSSEVNAWREPHQLMVSQDVKPVSSVTMEYTNTQPSMVYNNNSTPFIKMDDVELQARNRKRQRPQDFSSSYDTRGNMAIMDVKLDFAGFEMSHGAPVVRVIDPAYTLDVNPHQIVDFFNSLNLIDRTVVTQAIDRLAQYGFDTILTLAFTALEDLHHAGVMNLTDRQVIYNEARRIVFKERRFQGPGILADSCTVSRWLMFCGIPKKCSFEYAERLCRLGYPSVRDLDLFIHDNLAMEVFLVGHCRLVIHCLNIAENNARLAGQIAPNSAQSMVLPQHHPSYNHHYGLAVYDAEASSALLHPVDLHRENEFDTLLDALIQPTSEEQAQQAPGFPLGAGSFHGHPAHHHAATSGSVDNPSKDTDGYDNNEEYSSDGMFHPDTSRMSISSAMNNMNFHTSSTGSLPSVNGASGAIRTVPQEVIQLLYEAVNMPRPNPCRRGKKIYWSVLANRGMKEERFAVLGDYSAAELQNAYLRQFELPANTSVKIDAWSDENIRQLEHAVKDPRCRHLSKVCWEMLATGRTGVEEYAPLAKFSASQLRSRFRSLFGDKRPQKLRQKKQMLKMQQDNAIKQETS